MKIQTSRFAPCNCGAIKENCKLKIHFVGIGGIGVSALAQYYLSQGHKVSGSDLARSEITDMLRKKGARVFIGKHKAKNLPVGLDMVIYSPAVPANNPELKSAGKLQVQSYPEALGELTKKYFTIAVSGTHGKSTTSAMIALMMIKAGLDPTVIIGTKLKEFGESNFRPGKSQYLVIEADEWQASFLHYWPKVIVLTNIEKEHMDFYRDMRHISRAYLEYLSHLASVRGCIVANKRDGGAYRIAKIAQKRYGIPITWYSLGQKGSKAVKKALKIPGKHNVENALAALTAIRYTSIPAKIALKALSEYRGAWRRFETVRLNEKLTLVSDYGHHPTEIRATLQAAKEKWPQKELWLVFQPHQYQRTFFLFDEFVKVFRQIPIDKAIITDIYDVAGREKTGLKEQVSAKKLVRAIAKPYISYISKEKIVTELKQSLPSTGAVLIVMGAGDIYQTGVKIRQKFSTAVY